MKRFTESLKWADQWFRKLSMKHKLFWLWLCDNCDSAGVIEPDFELAAFQIGERIEAEDLEVFNARIVKINRLKFWIVKFVPFQYGQLTEVCRAHVPVIRLVEKHGLTDRLLIPYPMATNSHKREEKEKEQDKDGGVQRGAKDAIPTTPEAIAISELFSRRLTTEWSKKEIESFKSACKRGVVTVPAITTISRYYVAERAKGNDGRHRRDLCTFLNNFDGELDRATSACAPTPKAPRELPTEVKGMKFV